MTLTLVRHTRVFAPGGLCYGRTEVPTADTFEAEAGAIKAQLARLPIVVFSSPAARCRRLAATFGAELRIDERLHELDFGAWENRQWRDLPVAELDRWGKDFVHQAPPGGESFAELADRVKSFRRECYINGAVIVTHGGVIRAWLCLAQKQPLSSAFEFRVDFGAVISVR